MAGTNLFIYAVQILVTMDINAIEAQVAMLQRIVSFRSARDPRLWWIIDDKSSLAMTNNRTLPNQDKLHTCMSVLDQIGVNRTDVVEVMGSRRWSKTLAEVANKDGDKYFALGVYNHCKFVSIRTKDDGNMESASPEHGLIVQKESDEGESGMNQFRVQDSLHTPSTLADDCSAGDMDSASPKHGVIVKKKSKFHVFIDVL